MTSITTPQEPETPVFNILGEKVALGPTSRSIVPLMYRWLNDFQVSFLSGDDLQPTTLEALYAEYDRHSAQEKPSFRYLEYVLYERASLRPIGFAGLRHINHRSRTATLGILIGEKDCWHKGYGTEATKLILEYGFSVLNLHNIDLTTYAYNHAAVRAYLKAGFREVGRRREAHRWHDRVYDEVIMDCLATEFQSPEHPLLNLP